MPMFKQPAGYDDFLTTSELNGWRESKFVIEVHSGLVDTFANDKADDHDGE